MAVHQNTGWAGRDPIAASRSKARRPEVAEHLVLKQEQNSAGEEAPKLSTASRLLEIVMVGTTTKGCEIVFKLSTSSCLRRSMCASLNLWVRLMQAPAKPAIAYLSHSTKGVLQAPDFSIVRTLIHHRHQLGTSPICQCITPCPNWHNKQEVI